MDPAGYRVSLSRARSEDDRMVYYVEDYHSYNPDFRRSFEPHGLCPPGMGERPRRSSSACSQTDRPRRIRHSVDGGHSPTRPRRSSIQSGRSRANSCSRPTPLGDGRRASVNLKKSPGSRRPSATGQRRKDSVRPVKADTQVKQLMEKSPMEDEQARRHRRIAMMVIGTFVFLLAAAVLVVVVTLTHSSFHSPPIGDRELAEHRAQLNRHLITENNTLRKENEELLNSLNRDTSIPENSTAAPT